MDGLGGDVELGLRRGLVRVVDSDLGWPAVFRRLAADLRRALDGLAVAVEHIGSTSVPGLAAKPIIDIAVGLGPRPESPASSTRSLRWATCIAETRATTAA